MFKPRIFYFIALLVIIGVGSSTANELDKITFTNQSLQTENEFSTRVGEESIKQLFEVLREKIKTGINIKGLVIPLDPFRFPFWPVFFTKSPNIVSGKIYLIKLLLEGLAGFDLYKVNLSLLGRLTLGLKFPQISFSTEYRRANLELLEKMKIYGTRGIIDLKLDGFDVDVSVTIDVLSLQLRNPVLVVTLPKSFTTITGLYDDERMSGIISRQLTDTLQTLAVEEHDRVNIIFNNALKNLINNVINPCLDGLTIEDIWKIINGEKKFCEKDVEEVLMILGKKIVDTTGIDTNCLNDINKCKSDLV
ncbi:hypothetical protein ILUMI_22025 [Ignelater luminosus]|uniref:Uncharacterized protein n=1 Tax=Ignelater luminosus TaxID=2038154 RepID=A0A8K0CEK8_IGNLU|nr:hypothetical protein ILUMI_22025 [Ignelater luminosus]